MNAKLYVGPQQRNQANTTLVSAGKEACDVHHHRWQRPEGRWTENELGRSAMSTRDDLEDVLHVGPPMAVVMTKGRMDLRHQGDHGIDPREKRHASRLSAIGLQP